MFSSITKAWNEVAEETDTDTSVRFTPVSRRPQSSKHYIQHDRASKNPLDRLKRDPAIRRGSPRVLKPSNENKKNLGIWNTLGKIGKVFKGEDSELKGMKNYMDGMITKRPRFDEGRPNGARDRSASLERVQSRVESVNERAERFARENASPEKPQAKPHQQPHMKRIYLKDLSEAESSRDSIVDKIHRRSLRAHTVDSSLRSAARNMPSSPLESRPVASTAGPNDSVKELTRKVAHLEDTLESLVAELRQSNERSRQLEESIRGQQEFLKQEHSNHTILRSEDMDKLPAPMTIVTDPAEEAVEDEFEEVSRSLSPVKLDLRRFKFVK